MIECIICVYIYIYLSIDSTWCTCFLKNMDFHRCFSLAHGSSNDHVNVHSWDDSGTAIHKIFAVFNCFGGFSLSTVFVSKSKLPCFPYEKAICPEMWFCPQLLRYTHTFFSDFELFVLVICFWWIPTWLTLVRWWDDSAAGRWVPWSPDEVSKRLERKQLFQDVFLHTNTHVFAHIYHIYTYLYIHMCISIYIYMFMYTREASWWSLCILYLLNHDMHMTYDDEW